MPSPEALYNAVKTGSVKLTDLNDDGKTALRSFMDAKNNTTQINDQSQMDQQQQQFADMPKVESPQPQSFASQAQSLNADDANGNRRTDYPGGFLNPVNDLNRLYNAPLVRELTHGAGQAMGLQDNQMSASKSTGSGLVDSVANIVGQGVGYMTNPAQIEQNVGQTFFNNPLLNVATNRIGGSIENALPNNIASRALSSAAQGAATGAIGSALYAPFNTLNQGQDVKDIPNQIVQQSLMGAALGGGLGGLGSLAKSGLKSLGDTFRGAKEAPLPDYSNVRLSNNDVSANPATLADTKIPQMPETANIPNQESFKVGDSAIPTTADGAHLSEPKIIEDIQSKDGVNYYKFEGSNTYMPENMVSKASESFNSQNKPLNVDAAKNEQIPLASTLDGQSNMLVNKPSITKEEFKSMMDSGDYFIRTVRTPQKDMAGRTSTPAGKIGIDLGLSSDTHKGLSGFNLKDQARMLEWMGKEGWAHENVAVYKGTPTKEQVTLDPGEVEFKPSQLVGYVPTKLFKEHGGDFHKALTSIDTNNSPITPIRKLSGTISGLGDSVNLSKKVLNADVQPSKLSDAKSTEDVIQTKEPRLRDKIYNALDQAEQAARERLAAKRNTLSSLPIDQYRDYSIIGAAKLGKGTIKFADWSEAMVKDFGQEIKPHLKDIYTMSKNQVKEAEKNVVNKEKFNKVEANPTLPDTSSQIQSKTIKEKTSLGQKLNQSYINTVDNVHRLNQFDASAKDANGGTLKPSDSAYKLALNSRNADMQARQILEHNMIDNQGNAVGDSLKSIARQIPAKDMKAFEDYQVAKHAPTRMARGETVYNDKLNMTIQKAKMITDNYEKSNPEFAKVNQDYQSFDHQLGQHWLVDTGMLKQEQWDQYRRDNPFYTPNNRIFSDLEKNSKFGSKRGFADQSNPIKQADGSQRPIVSPLESRIEHVATYVKTAKQNEVGQAIVRSLQSNPDALKGFAEIVHDQPHVDVNDMLQKNGPEGLMDHIAQTIESAKQKPDLTKGNIVNVLMNGEVVHLRITDPQFLEAVGNLSPQAQPKWIEAVGKVTHVMKTTTTGVNPIFGLTKNIWKDIPHAFIASKSTNNPVTFGKDLIGALIDVIGHREAYQSYKNIGGGHSSSLSADRNLLAQSVEKLVPSTGLGQTLKRNLVTKPYHMLENFNNAIETAPRLAEAKRVMKQGGGTYDSKVEALHQANDLTVNFNKRGNYVKQLDSLVPYLNASVQGLDQLVRMYKTNPVAASVKAAMAISVPTAILYAVNHNDPNYQNMSNYMKDNNFLIPNGDGTFTKIPKPREIGMLFSSLIERAMRQWNDHDPKAFQDFGSNLVQNFAPPGFGGAISGVKDNGITGAPLGAMRDSIAGPLINLGLNKDFVNRPIVPKDLASLSPKLQSDARTSEPAKFIGNLTNTSPKQLDYLAKSYLGGIASLGVPATTKGGSILNTLKQQVTADPLYSNDIQSNFYNEKAKQDQAKADAKATGIPAQRDLSGYYDKLASSMTPLRKAEKQIQNDSSLSNSEKQAKLRAIQTQMNSVLQRGLIK